MIWKTLIILGASEFNKQVEGPQGHYYEEINHRDYNFVYQQNKTFRWVKDTLHHKGGVQISKSDLDRFHSSQLAP